MIVLYFPNRSDAIVNIMVETIRFVIFGRWRTEKLCDARADCPIFLVVGLIVLCFVPVFSDENAVVAIPSERNDGVTVDNVEENVEDEQNTFVPTKEWQKVKPGQAVPAGLHVKMNLATGEKEARLLNDGKISGHHYQLQDDDDEHTSNDESKQKFSPQELKEALKKIKTEELALKIGEEKELSGKAKFRSIEELKKEFHHLKLAVKSESEILANLIGRYSTVVESDKQTVLQDLEYLVHQYDVARDFIKLHGLTLLMPDLNSTDSKIREMVAFVIGSAMQGNPQVQIAVLEQNAMQKLLRLVAFDPSTLVRARALYALSCLVRQFPFAQRRLVENGGFAIFAELFKDARPETQILQLKVIVLIHDLIIEQQLALKHSNKGLTGETEKVQQYVKLNILSAVAENNFCRLVPQLLPSPDYDTQEKVIGAMLTLVDTCGREFSRKLPVLGQMAQAYAVALSGDDDEYINSLHTSVTSLITKVEHTRKDEL